MKFKDWIDEAGIPITTIARRIGRTRQWTTDIALGRVPARSEDAKKIEILTEGKVNRAEILWPDEDLICVKREDAKC